MKLDELDIRILREYQKNAVESYGVIAEHLGEAQTTVFNRIKRMMSNGVISAVVPLISDEALGLHTTAWVQIGLNIDADCCKVAEEIAKNRGVVEVFEVAGEYDILVKVKVENNLALHDFTKGLEIPGIRSMATIIAFKAVKESPSVEV
jgi:Lrp/AsnC family transcriptional regulator, regulator for asnA, asnC and gidA